MPSLAEASASIVIVAGARKLVPVVGLVMLTAGGGVVATMSSVGLLAVLPELKGVRADSVEEDTEKTIRLIRTVNGMSHLVALARLFELCG